MFATGGQRANQILIREVCLGGALSQTIPSWVRFLIPLFIRLSFARAVVCFLAPFILNP